MCAGLRGESMTKMKTKIQGFTLIEMLLVMVIISIIIYASVGYVMQRAEQIRVDRTSLQMQQILNAGLSYYIDHGSWPAGPTLTALQGTYLPPAAVTFKSGWGQDFQIYAAPPSAPPPAPATTRLFYVMTPIISQTASGTAAAAAQTIAGLIPMGYVSPNGPGGGGTPPNPGNCPATATTCWVVGSVNIPGQNINNARAMNFAGLYHHGACVPVPECPVDVTNAQMQPEVMIVPVSVSGTYNTGDNTSVYPISSFTAYAKGPTAATAGPPPACSAGDTAQSCGAVVTPSGSYWRACLQVVTERGDVAANRTDAWGGNVTLAAFTRCAVVNEQAGSPFTVFTH